MVKLFIQEKVGSKLAWAIYQYFLCYIKTHVTDKYDRICPLGAKGHKHTYSDPSIFKPKCKLNFLDHFVLWNWITSESYSVNWSGLYNLFCKSFFFPTPNLMKSVLSFPKPLWFGSQYLTYNPLHRIFLEYIIQFCSFVTVKHNNPYNSKVYSQSVYTRLHVSARIGPSSDQKERTMI
jgi:hypothetical protein